MGAAKIIGIVLIASGAASLIYGNVTYTKDREVAKIGSVGFAVKSEETIKIPQWLSISAIAAGTLLLVLGGKKG